MQNAEPIDYLGILFLCGFIKSNSTDIAPNNFDDIYIIIIWNMLDQNSVSNACYHATNCGEKRPKTPYMILKGENSSM